MTTSPVSPHEQSVPELHAQTGSESAASQPPVSLTPAEPPERYFYFEDELPDPAEPSLVAPFQVSHAMPTVSDPGQLSGNAPSIPNHPSATQKGHKRRLSFPLIALLVCVMAIIGTVVMSTLVQATPPLQSKSNGHASPVPTSQRGSSPTPQGSVTMTVQGSVQGQTANPASNWIPEQLPQGWTDAGLTLGDALQAMRTAVAFNDREMSLDYRSVGTRNHHGGTLTAATFLFTNGARQRFQQHDVRVINNTLFDHVVTTRLIRITINAAPQVMKFSQLNRQLFAWVTVPFQLWQSQLDPNDPQHLRRIEGYDLDPATQQPRLHHMVVLLLRVAPEATGAAPPMGGTGWLVSTYALDQADGSLPEIVLPA
ncbi:MAG TPA: hypothetical protein VFB60_26575 [Ktedonobacteraceae bacterium]|nr:hypothetical protein [Ktedonobacteraceae bacterium]